MHDLLTPSMLGYQPSSQYIARSTERDMSLQGPPELDYAIMSETGQTSPPSSARPASPAFSWTPRAMALPTRADHSFSI